MLGAGIPMHRALMFYAEGGEQTTLTTIIDDVANQVAGGNRLSVALSRYPAVFPEIYSSMIEMGETSSQLQEVLERLADLQEKQNGMRKKIIATFTYPVLLCVISMLSVAVLVCYVLPLLTPLFDSLHVELPLPTRILLWSRHLFSGVLWGLVLLVLGHRQIVPFLRWFFARFPRLALWVDRTSLSLPVLGTFNRKVIAARVLHSLSTMLESGVVVLAAVKRCANVAGNRVIASKLLQARVDLADGATFFEAFSQNAIFPSACVQLITVGEETSSLAESVRWAAKFMEGDVDSALTTLAGLLEPIIMAGMGIIVGFILLSCMLPTVQLLNNL